MPRPLPQELKDAILTAIRGGMSISEAVEHFKVARRTIYYYLRHAPARSGDAVLPVSRRGARSRLESYREQILATRQDHPELTMRELIDLLKLPVTESTLSRTLAFWRRE